MIQYNRFSVVLADTPAAKKIHFAVRYAVYCEELGFEVGEVKQHIEQDQYDATAAHFVVWDHKERRWVATARVVPEPLPCEAVCGPVTNGLTPSGEFSRLAILPGYRQNDGGYFFQTIGHTPVLSGVFRNEVLIRLLRAICIWSIYKKHDRAYYLVERGFALLFRKLGWEAVKVGEPIEHHGMRQLYYVNPKQALDAIYTKYSTYSEAFRQTPAFTPYTRFSNHM